MRLVRQSLAITLVLLFMGLSVNAYACLVPVFSGTMGSGCSTPEEQQARQFCDNFKTLGIQANPELNSSIESHTISLVDVALMPHIFALTSGEFLAADSHSVDLPQDLLVTTLVLRI
jgi:hypothetical protein